MISDRKWALAAAVLLCVLIAAIVAIRAVDSGVAPEDSPADEPPPSSPSAAPMRPDSSQGSQLEPPAASLGRVRDPAGAPIANAQVCARRRPVRLPEPRIRCTRTDVDGGYRLELEPGDWVVGAGSEAHAPTMLGDSRSHATVGFSPGEAVTLDFTLSKPGRLVTGVVRDGLGGVVEGALVVLGQHPSLAYPAPVARTDADGRFALTVPAEGASLAGYHEGYGPGSGWARPGASELELVLLPETRVSGTVVWAEGEQAGAPVAGVPVWSVRQGGRAFADADGRFSLAISPYLGDEIIASFDGGYGRAELAGRPAGSNVELRVELRASATLHANIMDSSGPCDDGYVWLGEVVSEPMITNFVEGFARIPALPPGELELSFHCRGSLPEPRTLTLEPGRNFVRVELQPAATLDGTLRRSDGGPAANVSVRIAGPVSSFAVSDSSGRLFADWLVPGRYELSAREPARGEGIGPIIVEVPNAGASVELELEPQRSVVGRIFEPDGDPAVGVELALVEPERRWAIAHVVSDARGEFEIAAVPALPLRLFAGGLLIARVGEPLVRDWVALGEGDARELSLIAEERRRVELRVRSPIGEPLAGVRVELRRPGAEIGSALDLRIGAGVSDLDGLVEIDGVPAGVVMVGLPDGSEAELVGEEVVWGP